MLLYGILSFFYAVVCVFLILVVLLQTGKRADLAGAFGGGGSQTAFGARGAATLLTKLTTAAAILFMIGALCLSILSSKSVGQGGSVLDRVEEPAPASAPPSGEATSPPASSEGAVPSTSLGEDPTVPVEEPPADANQP